jgi:hypothetical protein
LMWGGVSEKIIGRGFFGFYDFLKKIRQKN